MAGLYYEEFAVGQEFNHPWTRTVTEMDNVLFTTMTMNVANAIGRATSIAAIMARWRRSAAVVAPPSR